MRSTRQIAQSLYGEAKQNAQDIEKCAAMAAKSHQLCRRKMRMRAVGFAPQRRDILHAADIAASQKSGALPAACEWFYDNRYLLSEQIRYLETFRSAETAHAAKRAVCVAAPVYGGRVRFGGKNRL